MAEVNIKIKATRTWQFWVLNFLLSNRFRPMQNLGLILFKDAPVLKIGIGKNVSIIYMNELIDFDNNY